MSNEAIALGIAGYVAGVVMLDVGIEIALGVALLAFVAMHSWRARG